MRRILVVGGGSIGERHVRCFLRTGRATVELCEVRDSLRQQVVQSYGLPNGYADFDEIDLPSFDAVVICTPANLHIPMATRAADAGIGILIEKPLSISTDGVDRLEQLIYDRAIPVSVAYVMRHHPALVAMKLAVESGRFGRALQFVSTSGQHFPFYRPAYRETYYTQHATGGGAIQDALTHIVNASQWLVGPIQRLVVDAEHCLLDGVDVEDTVHLLTRHSNRNSESGVMGSFTLNQHQAVNESTTTVICERGSVRMEGHHARWLSASEPDSEWKVEAEFELERDDLFVAQASAFLDQLDGLKGPACSFSEAKQTLDANLAALKSWRTEQWITP